MLLPGKNEVRKPTKTLSGITPLAVMLPPRKCNHGACVFCPNMNVPQSYTPKSPVVMRAAQVGYDAYKQVRARLEAFKAMNHPTEKVELIIMGGTFLQYPKKFQYDFIKGLYDGLNSKKSKTLEQAKKLNEKTKQRCIALCIETRPDVIDIQRMREFGCTRVELGVQIIDDKIYKAVKRGHTVQDVVKATKLLRDSGFKIGYHLMPGLPESSVKKDISLFKKIFSDERFKPDQIKIYPCQVMPGSELEKWYWRGKYKPYSKEDIESILLKMMKIVPRYCRVMRIMREIPPEYIVAGTIRIDLRKEVEKELRKKNAKIKEIRYREIGFALQRGKEIKKDLKLKITKYKAAKGQEYFLEIINSQDILFGLLRLRIVENRAIIRELHVYGQSLKLGEKGKFSQHRGLGKKLIQEAEKIARRSADTPKGTSPKILNIGAKKNKIKKLEIISGVGVREYYKKLGYILDKEDNEMMIKEL